MYVIRCLGYWLALSMSITLMKKLRIEEDKLNLEQENSNGEFMKMKAVLEKRIALYIKFLYILAKSSNSISLGVSPSILPIALAKKSTISMSNLL